MAGMGDDIVLDKRRLLGCEPYEMIHRGRDDWNVASFAHALTVATIRERRKRNQQASLTRAVTPAVSPRTLSMGDGYGMTQDASAPTAQPTMSTPPAEVHIVNHMNTADVMTALSSSAGQRAVAQALASIPATPPTDPIPVRPGWQTSEFWLKIAAIALSALFASGALTNNTALAIAGMAASILGALGYTVSRTLVKTAAPMLAVLLLGAHLISCSGDVKGGLKTAGKIAWDCTAPERQEAVGLLTPLAAQVALNGISADGKAVDLSPLQAATSKASLLTDLGVTLWCAGSEAIAALLHPPAAPAGSPQSSPLIADPTALAKAWQSIKPDAVFMTSVKDASGTQVVM